jgi:hypothetical protein
LGCRTCDSIKRLNMTNLAQNLEHWMSVLPQRLKSIPINQLAIPGWILLVKW